ncbi:metal ABC transporter permease [Colwellia sp. D2M02]|uniref:metal ABC transporter permease n=1 Tax=Colwellia TaxID=28228 RepID=UPI001C0841C4|nr:metal ABC transporter permease [Colwellia sp. D2M02]
MVFHYCASLKLVGIILVISLLIAPGAIAFLLTKHFSTMLFISIIVAIFSALVGVYLSFFLDRAPAPTIIMVMTFIFVVTFIVKQLERKRGKAQPYL